MAKLTKPKPHAVNKQAKTVRAPVRTIITHTANLLTLRVSTESSGAWASPRSHEIVLGRIQFSTPARR
jgi:hypothetical protein